MDTAPFESLLKQTMGLDAASIGASAVERAVRERMDACRETDPCAYLLQVSASKAELQELIEEVVVPETWFFRDREAFSALTRFAQEEWLRTHTEGALRVLSVPCSTGEEPYTIAMSLLDAGFPAARFRVDAVEISARSIARAHRALYGRNSFRGENLEFRARHFEPEGQQYRLTDRVRQQVHFHQANLLDPGFSSGGRTYNVIFCRNLLIYFDRATQNRVVQTLKGMLSEKGVMFVGPAEAGLMLENGFVSVKAPMAFGFRKAEAVVREPSRRAVRAVRAVIPRAVPARRNATTTPLSRLLKVSQRLRPAAFATVVVAKESAPSAGTSLEEIQRLADSGRLDLAGKSCAAYIRQHGPSAQAFYVSGLVHDASGDAGGAEAFYRKAIYLNPNHQEALIHLAFLLAQQGNHAGAKVMQARVRRLEETTSR